MKEELCKCTNWCRSDIGAPYHVRSDDGIPIPTDHHPNCDRYNESLIDVWRVSYNGSSYVTDREPTSEDGLTGEETVTQEKMHREVYENLPEFEGF